MKKQKISKESYLMESAVNTYGPIEVQNNFYEQASEKIQYNQIYCLMDKIVSKDNMTNAYRRVKLNNGAPGIDEMKVEELKDFLNEKWCKIKEQLLNGTYEPKPVRRVEIPKPDGGTRELGIPTVLDRLIQQAILQTLSPIYDSNFSDNSYGFRPKKNAKQAVKKAQEYINLGYKYVVDIDIEKFFDKVNHDKLMAKLSSRINDPCLIKLIRKYLKCGVMLNGCCIASEEGTPQGGPLSPLLANIILDELDKELIMRGHKFVRYADDFNIYVKSSRAGQRVLASISRFIERKLKLKVNTNKSGTDLVWKRKILGFSFIIFDEPKIRIHQKSKHKFKTIIRKITSRRWGISIEERIRRLNLYLRGWIEYFKLAETKSVFEELDGWIRRRMRMCLLKQWKKSKTKIKMLMILGLPEKEAKKIGYSRKKYWRNSLTLQLHNALNKKFWREAGLISLFEKYTESIQVY